jgi:hypothetical protein
MLRFAGRMAFLGFEVAVFGLAMTRVAIGRVYQIVNPEPSKTKVRATRPSPSRRSQRARATAAHPASDSHR